MTPALAEPEPMPWLLSTGRTAAWGLAILFVTGLANTLALGGLSLATGRVDASGAPQPDAFLGAIGVLVSSAVGGALTLAVLWRREPREYLALARPTPRGALLGLLAMGVCLAALDGLGLLLGRPLIPEESFEAARSTPLLLLILAFVVVAPVYEEVYFRGFLFRGLAAGRIGPLGAALVTAVLFSLVHFPTSAYDAFFGLVLGLLLAGARHATGSLLVSVAMHALANAVTIAQVLLLMPDPPAP